MGIGLDFKIHGLSLLFSLLITGIGTLVFLYASSYLKKHIYLNRFYCYLTAFMGAMLGVVLSDNLITLFVFWELTSISSFFLIGFNNEDEDSRKSSLWALSITGLGGFFMLAAFVLIGSVTQTYSIRSEEHTSELQPRPHLVCRLLLEKNIGAQQAFQRDEQRDGEEVGSLDQLLPRIIG